MPAQRGLEVDCTAEGRICWRQSDVTRQPEYIKQLQHEGSRPRQDEPKAPAVLNAPESHFQSANTTRFGVKSSRQKPLVLTSLPCMSTRFA